METIDTYVFAGYHVTVIRPEHPNGKWIWKTEFLYAFDTAERALLSEGYTRVYYEISNKYGSDEAVRLMHAFHLHVTEKYGLEKKTVLFGFSRGGLYAFRYAMFYPELVAGMYLDAPVLDFSTWPPKGSEEQAGLFAEYGLNADTLPVAPENPVHRLADFLSLGLPLCIVAGGADEIVPFEANAKKLLDLAAEKNYPVTSEIKPTCGHHPHSLEDPARIVNFVNNLVF